MTEQQTVEDLGKLVKSKYPDAYGKMSDSEVGTAVKSKYPDAYGNFSDKPKELTGTEKTRNLLVTGSPSGPGHYSPEGKGTFEFPKALNVAGAVAAPLELGAGMMQNPGGVLNLVKSAYSGLKEGLPKVLGGAVLAGTGAGLETASEGLTHLPSYARYVASYPGIRMMGRGVAEGARAFGQEFKPPGVGNLLSSEATGPAILPKGPSPKWNVDSPIKSVETLPEQPGPIGKVELPSGRKAPLPQERINLAETKPEVKPLDPRAQKIQEQYAVLKQELDRLAPGNKIGEVLKPGEAQPLSQGLGEIRVQKSLEGNFKEPGTPLSEKAIEEAQAPSRAAKENKLAQHLAQSEHDLDNLPKTPEFRKSVSKEAGLDYKASPRTLEAARLKAKELRKGQE